MRNWVKGIFGSNPPPTGEQTQRSAQQVRDDRASAVIELRTEVRRLQQEITDLSNAGENGGSANERTARTKRLASLQRQLEQKQAELGKYQARV